MELSARIRRRLTGGNLRDDAVAGVVLGVESVPDGLALGVLAGVNPLAGLYGYMYGTFGGALATSTSVLTVQVTGATAIIVADADLGSFADPARALYTLSLMAGVIMVVAGLAHAGRLLRFVPRAVMVGFISGVGVNTVLGQLGNFTGYHADGSNRVLRALDLLVHFWRIDLPSLTVGAVTLALIVVLQRTRLRALGLVVAIVAGSVLTAALDALGHDVARVGDIATVTRGLPFIAAPLLGDVPALLIPAVAVAFVGMVQGAGVAVAFPNPDGRPSNPSRDFIGQGVGSILSGLFRGMPASGSMSATALTVQAGARSRVALFIAGGVMAVIVVLLGGAVGYVSFPALAALLIVVGIGTVRPAQIMLAIHSSPVQAAVVIATFALTMIIPVQFAVLAGVALAVVLFTIEQSNRITVRRLELDERGHIRESDPPTTIPPGDVVILQPYGSLFFASATGFRAQLPAVTAGSHDSVVILRLRGVDDLGVSVAGIIDQYAADLADAGSKLVVNGGDVLRSQMEKNGLLARIGADNFYLGGEWHGRALARANADAGAWIESRAST